jgi:hypothetical protein
MREAFVDPETGWSATRETVIAPRSCIEVISETVADPLTGEVYRRSRVPGYQRSLTEWVQEIVETKEMMKEFRGASKV